MLREDVTLEMPPHLTWFAGRSAVARFFGVKVFGRAGAIRTMTASANGQPALATYTRGPDGRHHPHSMQVLTLDRTGISRIVSFYDPSLFEPCGLPARIDANGRPAR